MNEKVKPILRWPGGKSRMLKHLLPIIPEHVCYCEPFAGGLAMLLAKPRSPVEIINDLNGDLVSLYKNVQRHLPEMVRQISMALGSRQMMQEFIAQPGLTDLERSVRFYIRNRVSFAGNCHSFGVAKTKGGGASLNRTPISELLGAAHERLDGVVIEHISYERIFKNYDSADTIFFCDPPYVDAPTGAYEGWTAGQMNALRGELGRLKGKFILTVNDSEFTREAFKGFEQVSFSSRNGLTKNKAGQVQFKELVIKNY